MSLATARSVDLMATIAPVDCAAPLGGTKAAARSASLPPVSVTQPFHLDKTEAAPDGGREADAAPPEEPATAQPPEAEPQPAPVVDRLTTLEPLLLARVAARLRLDDASALASASRHLHQELRELRAFHALARAMLDPRKAGRRLSPTMRKMLASVACTPQAIAFLRAWVVDDRWEVLRRPDVCEWVLAAAAARKDERTLDWLLDLHDAQQRTELLRHQVNPAIYDEYWIAAAGHAAGAGHVSLLRLLLNLPSAPDQRLGLRRLNSDKKRTLMVAAMTRPRGAPPPTEEEQAAARETVQTIVGLLNPLLLLPYRTRPTARWPFGDIPPEEAKAERERAGALLAAANTAVASNLHGALTALFACGLSLADAGAVQRLMGKAVPADAGDALRELFMLPCGPNNQPVWEVHSGTVASVAGSAVSEGKARVIRAIMDVRPTLVLAPQIRTLLINRHIELTLAVIKHPRSELAVPITDQQALEVLVRTPTEEEALRVWTELLALGQPVTPRLIELAKDGNKPQLTQVFETRLKEQEVKQALRAARLVVDTSPASTRTVAASRH